MRHSTSTDPITIKRYGASFVDRTENWINNRKYIHKRYSLNN